MFFLRKLLACRERPAGYLIGFFLLFMVLQYGFQLSRGTVVERLIIDVVTVKVSVMLINKVSPGERVVAIGEKLVSPQTRLSILNGCEGVESILLVIAAIMALPKKVKYKVQAIVLGIVVIYWLNQIRIVMLYYSLRYNHIFFDTLHGFVAPSFIVMIICILFVLYLKVAMPR